MTPAQWDQFIAALTLWCVFTLPGVFIGYSAARWQLGQRVLREARRLGTLDRKAEAIAILTAFNGEEVP